MVMCPDEGFAVKQAALVREAEEGAARKAFDLALPALGPYALDWTRNGRFLLLGGRRGHLALLDWQSAKLLCEVQVRWGTGGAGFWRERAVCWPRPWTLSCWLAARQAAMPGSGACLHAVQGPLVCIMGTCVRLRWHQDAGTQAW